MSEPIMGVDAGRLTTTIEWRDGLIDKPPLRSFLLVCDPGGVNLDAEIATMFCAEHGDDGVMPIWTEDGGETIHEFRWWAPMPEGLPT